MEDLSIIPNQNDISKLVSFIPVFEDPEFEPIVEWFGGETDSEGVMTMPHPDYNEKVYEFFNLVASKGWMDRDYLSNIDDSFLGNDEPINKADIPQIKSMLTYCLRSERFGDGLWDGYIREGVIVKILKRLEQLSSEL